MRVLANGAQIARSIQFLETTESLKFAGKTATAQIKIRRNSTLTQDTVLAIQKSPTVDAGIAATWTTISSVTIANASMPTGTTSSDWYTASVTFTVPNDGTANSLRFYFDSGTIPNGGYYEIAEAQLEVGSVATPFSRAGGTLQGELAACQRYYQRIAADSSNSGSPLAQGFATSTTVAKFKGISKVTGRGNPTIAVNSASGFRVWDGVNSAVVSTAVSGSAASATLDGDFEFTVTVASGLTQFRPYTLIPANGAAAWIELNMEL
jgi:hypothetical protein